MRNFYITSILFLSLSVFAQNPEIKAELPTIMGPSPTTAALMKFEEVPVNNYTGIPDINIPLFSTPTHSKDVGLNISLNYHPAGAAYDEVSSDAGLGWSLMAGGTISRTVRGLPDEYFKRSGSASTGRIGIYHTDPLHENNNYYEFIADSFSTVSYELNEFLWEAQEKGKYDTEHDLWQFNFMGQNGRFIIKKNMTTGLLEVVNLDLTSTVKIVNDYTFATVNNTPIYTFNGFTIYDDKGYKYVFDVKENTYTGGLNHVTHHSLTEFTPITTQKEPMTYLSAFQLSNVYDNNGQLLVNFIYNGAGEIMKEVKTDATLTTNTMIGSDPNAIMSMLKGFSDENMEGQNLKLEPKSVSNFTLRSTETKKIKQIRVNGISKFFFSYEGGRLDQDTNVNAYRIKEIIQTTWDSIPVKKMELFHSYSSYVPNSYTIVNRMFLNKVTESRYTDTTPPTLSPVTLSQELSYANPLDYGLDHDKDPWGFFILKPPVAMGYELPMSNFSKKDVLQKMTMPMGGCKIFDFEANRYSYIGDTLLTDFSGNPENWILAEPAYEIFTTVRNNARRTFFTISHEQDVTFYSQVNVTGNINDLQWQYTVTKEGLTRQEFQIPIYENCGQSCSITRRLFPGTYEITFETFNVDQPTVTFQSAEIYAHYVARRVPEREYLYGGGNRIKRISFFENSDVPQDFYDVDYSEEPITYEPALEKYYQYNFFANGKNSGSLAFAYPVFEYDYFRNTHFRLACTLGNLTCVDIEEQYAYTARTSFNNLQFLRTKGSDVGYTNVTVSQQGFGKTEFTYTSPIDHPEDSYSFYYPFHPPKNLDYKRGLLLKEKLYDSSTRPLKEIDYDYSFVNDSTLIGVRTYFKSNCQYSYRFNTYHGTLGGAVEAISENEPCDLYQYPCGWICGYPIENIGWENIYDATGWAKLATKTTKNYFYQPTQVNNEITETFTYNPLNKKIASYTTTNSFQDEILKTDYFYHSGDATTRNRISEIEQIDNYRGSYLLSKRKIGYRNTFLNNSSWLPETIQTADRGLTAFDNRIRIVDYDQHGNPLEMKQEFGAPTSYIWGYNQTLPIAKIENISYSVIAPFVAALQSASNGTESGLLSALETFRAQSVLANSMVTTYTYKPLVGISTITDPKQERTNYSYDGFGRLEKVAKTYGTTTNIISEHSYYYRTTNDNLDQNYVKTINYKVPANTSLVNPTAAEADVSISYFDGLGRPIQNRAHRQSDSGKDIVTHIEYDDFGRQPKEFLPFVSPASLAYDPTAGSGVYQFYSTSSLTGNPAFETMDNPYSEKQFESSPLNRVFKQSAPGNVWAMGAGKEVKTDYLLNGVNEVKMFTAFAILPTTTHLVYMNNSNYAANTLYKTITKDENWVPADGNKNTTIEFKDMEGRVVLIRKYAESKATAAAVPAYSWHDTYYVYDQFGTLAYVIPPGANIVGTIRQEQVYSYIYDYRNRMFTKKIPGKGSEFLIYDRLDRVIATGPEPSPDGTAALGFLTTKYDAFNRPVITTWLPSIGTHGANGAGRNYIQNDRNAQTTNFSETRSSPGTTMNNVSFGYTNKAWPIAGYHVLTVNYYDDYTFTGAPDPLPASILDSGQPVYYNNAIKPKGLPTGSWTRTVESLTATPVKFESGHILYDYQARPLREYTQNHLLGYTQTDYMLDFTKILFAEKRHKRDNVSDELLIREDFTYTANDKPLSHMYKINSLPTELLSSNTYDELGQLISKKVGYSLSNPLQKIDYAYNARGWLKQINSIDDFTKEIDGTTAQSPADIFAFKINYNTVENTIGNAVKPLYNGNISETFWKTGSDDILRSYGYQYDEISRLKHAYYQNTGLETGSYDEEIEYDKNGNIVTMKRNGDRDAQNQPIGIDNMVYTYDTLMKDRLLKVLDTSNDPAGFDDDSNGVTDADNDYGYDAFGNMTSDQNKNINNITYNHLHLPLKIQFGTDPNTKIEYLYNAVGQKLKKTVYSIKHNFDLNTFYSDIDVTDYFNGFQYTNGKLSFFPTTEGYVKNTVTGGTTNNFSYVYNYTDHLGNIRMSYTRNTDGTLAFLEENHYYPFGLKHNNYSSELNDLYGGEGDSPGGVQARAVEGGERKGYQYKYNGKEWQDELGLNMYDYHARNYDPAIGRWMNIDPKAEESRRWSPYTYAMNNPVFFIDRDGMSASNPDWYIDNRSGAILGQDGAATNDYRLVDNIDFEQIKNDNGGSTTTPTATAQLQSPDVSTPVTVNDAQIQQEAQDVTDLSRTNEHQTQIVLNKYTGEVTAKRDTPGTDGAATVNSFPAPSGATLAADGSSLLLGVIHGHNLTQKAGKVNVTGTSPDDRNTAGSLGITVYETDAYNTQVGGSANVGRVTSDGVQTDNVGQTKGSGQGTFNFGLDALNNLPR